MTEQIFEFNPQSSSFFQDRHSILKHMRNHLPIHSEQDVTATGRPITRWNFTTYEDALLVLRDKRFVREVDRVLPPEAIPPVPEAFRTLAKSQSNIMLFRDPPNHTRLRTLINQAFTPRIVEQLEPRIQEIALHLLSSFEPGSRFDFVQEFAFALPVVVIADLLGVPMEDRDQFKNWSTLFIRTIDFKPTLETLIQGEQATLSFREYFREIVRHRRHHPKDDLISELIRVREKGDSLTEEELLDMCILILVAGHETTVNLIANGMYLFATHPDAQALLRRDSKFLASAVEEVLRYESPIQATGRIIGEDMQYKGYHLKRGDIINAWLASANRDESVFSNPDVFDVTRQNNPHLSFGQGIHYCLGAPLARKEAAISFETILAKYDTVRLATQQVEWAPMTAIRSLKELILQV